MWTAEGKKTLNVLPPFGVICSIKIIRSVVREDCTVSAQSGIALFLQTDTLFPALSLAGAGSSREAVAWELCSTPGWQKQ